MNEVGFEEWDRNQSYETGDTVQYQSNMYVANQSIEPGVYPSSINGSSIWSKMEDNGDIYSIPTFYGTSNTPNPPVGDTAFQDGDLLVWDGARWVGNSPTHITPVDADGLHRHWDTSCILKANGLFGSMPTMDEALAKLARDIINGEKDKLKLKKSLDTNKENFDLKEI